MKLNDTQMHYPVTEKELLAIFETLRHNHNMLHGCEIVVKTDHKNLTHQDARCKACQPEGSASEDCN